jgi:uncharacterized protein (DUF697 family)
MLCQGGLPVAWGNITTLYRTLREVRLGEIKAGIERRFSVLVIGDAAHAAALADALSAAPGQAGRHPWIEVLPATDAAALESWITSDPRTDKLALVAVGAPGLSMDELRVVQRLGQAGVPQITAVLRDGVEPGPSAGLPRQNEGARARLPSAPDAEALRDRLAPALFKVTPEVSGVRLALARRLPVLRDPVIADLIEDVARSNAIYAVSTGIAEIAPVLTIPLVAADTLILTKNQLVLAYKIALICGKQGSPRDVMGEVIGVIGTGLVLRQIAREMVGLIPVIGIVPKVAIAYAGTRVIGNMVYVWAARGYRLSPSDMRKLYREALTSGRGVADLLVDKVRGSSEAPGPAVPATIARAADPAPPARPGDAP